MTSIEVSGTHRIALTLRLALLDFAHDRMMSVCSIVGVVVVIAPLLILFSLKSGFVEGLLTALRTEPSTLELRPIGQGVYRDDWFAALAGRPGVAFLVPNTRFLSAEVLVRVDRVPRGQTIEAELMPTAAGDPFLREPANPPIGGHRATISWALSERLDARPGDVMHVVIGRMKGGVREQATLEMTVHSVVQRQHFAREALFVDLPTLQVIEAYREGAIPGPDVRHLAALDADNGFSSFRLFAASLEDVLSLEEWLLSQGVDVHTRSTDIRRAFLLDELLTMLFGLLLILGAVGAGSTLGVTSFASVLRKQRQLSILRLVGVSSLQVAAIPVVQSLVTAAVGYVLATALLLAVMPVLRRVLGQGDALLVSGQSLIVPGEILLGGVGTVFVALVATYASGVRASSVEPSQGIRDE